MTRIMVVDDEEPMRHMLSVILKREGYDVTTFEDASEALKSLDDDDFDFILSDIRMPGMDGLEFLKALGDKRHSQTVIMMSAYGTMDSAVECIKLGAYDYVSKPFKPDEIILTLKKAGERERLKRENLRLKQEALDEYDFKNIFTEDPAMLDILALVKKVASYDTSVLIEGESGTGKELVARALHYGGDRAAEPLVAVNCGAIPAPLLESELFGHRKGAFTDAHRDKLGLFKEADGGTILLDEVGEMPMELQVKLLRVLQEGEVRRVGDTRAEKISTRVVAATVKDLGEEIKTGGFREDLYYRLKVIEIRMPPLRERAGDIPGLTARFISKYAKKFGKQVTGLTDEAASLLSSYSWPGNVRELENVIERAMILEDTDTITKSSLPASDMAGAPAHGAPSYLSRGLSIKKAQEEMERELIRRALEKTGGNRTRAAEFLEISHRALLYKIKSYGL